MTSAAPRLYGFRRCLQCGYNLSGQPVVHDRDLDIFLARCPECGAAASLSDHPLLGPWCTLWAALAALGWWIIAGLLLVTTATSLFSFNQAVVAIAGSRYAHQLSDAYRADQEARFGGAAAGSPSMSLDGTVIIVNRSGNQSPREWWASQDQDAILAASGGWWGAIDRNAVWTMLPLSLAALTWGSVWGIALVAHAGARGPRLSRILIAPMVTASLIAVELPLIQRWNAGEIGWMFDAANSQIGRPVLVAALVVTATVFLAGQAMGPRVARAALRLTLFPRQRRAFQQLYEPAARRGRPVQTLGTGSTPRNLGASLE